MQNTMNLLETALKLEPIPAWTRKLGLSAQALYNARDRGHLSPAIAGALAEELGEDPQQWVFVAAMESERESACKERMLKRLKRAVRSYFNWIGSVARPSSSHKGAKDTHALSGRGPRPPAQVRVHR